VIAVDTNLLVYAHREDSPWHREALDVMTELADGNAPWAIPWPCAHEFLAIVTHPKIYKLPTPMDIAIKAIRAWTDSPTLHLIGESPDHLERLEHLVLASKSVGPMVHDARIAALCLAHGIRQFWSADRDFSRFPSLKIRNPLIG
jgi:toxin-antitoxin system PIN domain toxin